MESQVAGLYVKFLISIAVALLILSGISAALVRYIEDISNEVTLRDEGRDVQIVTLEKR